MKRSFLISGLLTAAIVGVVAHQIPHKPHTLPAANSQPAPAAVAKSELAPLPQAPPAEMSAPKSLVVPKLGIDAPIIKVGLDAEGNMATPLSLIEAGWYGVIPGNPGRAVITGHTGYPNARTAFSHFNELQKGDSFQVIDINGAVAEFEVYSTQRVTPQEAPLAHIFGDSPTPRVALITCDGTWNDRPSNIATG